jgi:apolipoprotein N-acyltransferase
MVLSRDEAGAESRWFSGGLSLAAGLAAAFAFPPFGFWPGLLGYALLMGLWDRAAPTRPLRSAFWRGWLAGTGFFLVSTWWVAEAFYVDAQEQGWMAPIAVALLAGGLGLFWGAAGALYARIHPAGAVRVLVFAGTFSLLEWLRGHVLTGFPWDLAGETWRAGSAPSQAASIVGAYGLGWITVAACSAPALLWPGPRRRGGWIAAGLAAFAIVALYGYGALRLAAVTSVTLPASHQPWVRVVQANVDQESKYDEALFRSILDRYLRLTAQPAQRTPDIVIWPEGAIPDSVNAYLAPDAWTRAAITGALKPGQVLLLGGYRFAGPPDQPPVDQSKAYNSLLALRAGSADLTAVGVYDKYRLVPFGEYLPAEGLLAPLGFKKLVHVTDGFDAGPVPRPLLIAGAPPVQPLICYESLFPGFVRNGARLGGRAAWIVNISNDAWFGKTSGPWQHLNIASYRAIEEGLPMVRATPTGVSAVIDAYGRIAPGQRLGQGAFGVIDAPLPPALAPTPFSRWGEIFFWGFVTLSAVFGRYVRTNRSVTTTL